MPKTKRSSSDWTGKLVAVPNAQGTFPPYDSAKQAQKDYDRLPVKLKSLCIVMDLPNGHLGMKQSLIRLKVAVPKWQKAFEEWENTKKNTSDTRSTRDFSSTGAGAAGSETEIFREPCSDAGYRTAESIGTDLSVEMEGEPKTRDGRPCEHSLSGTRVVESANDIHFDRGSDELIDPDRVSLCSGKDLAQGSVPFELSGPL